MRSLLSIDMHEHLNHNWKPQLLLLYTLREVEQQEEGKEYTEGRSSQGAVATPTAAVNVPVVTDLADVDLEGGMTKAIAGHTHEHMFSVAQQLRHGSGLIIAGA